MADSEVKNRLVALAECRDHPQNYNTHPEGQIEDLMLSLRKFGQVRSIVVQDDGADGFLLVAGHGVCAAARLEGFEELKADVIPVDWPPAKVLAYLAADNELPRQRAPDEAQLAAICAQVQEEADAELARLAAGSELDLLLITSHAQLAQELGDLIKGDTLSKGRSLGDSQKKIRSVLYVEDLGDFEAAILKTGIANRGEALLTVCRYFLDGG